MTNTNYAKPQIPGHIYKKVTAHQNNAGKKTGMTVELNNGVSFVSDSYAGTVGVKDAAGDYKELARGRSAKMEFNNWNGLTIANGDAEMSIKPDGTGWAKDLRTAVSMVPIGPAVALLTGVAGEDYTDRSASMMKGYAREEFDSFTISSSDGRSPDSVSEANLHGSGGLARKLGVEFSLPGRRRKTNEVELADQQVVKWNDQGKQSSLTLPASLEYFQTA